MKLHVHFQSGALQVDEVISGDTAEALVAAMQKRVAQEAGFLVGTAVRAMSPLKFAQEATRRYNATAKDDAPIPNSCDEFIQTGIAKNFATPLDEAQNQA